MHHLEERKPVSPRDRWPAGDRRRPRSPLPCRRYRLRKRLPGRRHLLRHQRLSDRGHFLDERRRTGTISLSAFYERRARRIAPAMFVVVTATAVTALSFFPPVRMNELSRSMIATFTFSANFWFLGQSHYFRNGHWRAAVDPPLELGGRRTVLPRSAAVASSHPQDAGARAASRPDSARPSLGWDGAKCCPFTMPTPLSIDRTRALGSC